MELEQLRQLDEYQRYYVLVRCFLEARDGALVDEARFNQFWQEAATWQPLRSVSS